MGTWTLGVGRAFLAEETSPCSHRAGSTEVAEAPSSGSCSLNQPMIQGFIHSWAKREGQELWSPSFPSTFLAFFPPGTCAATQAGQHFHYKLEGVPQTDTVGVTDTKKTSAESNKANIPAKWVAKAAGTQKVSGFIQFFQWHKINQKTEINN